MQFEVEKDADGEKFKAINVTNADGTAVVPPPRERRRRANKEGSGDEGAADDKQEDKAKTSAGRNQRKPRNSKSNNGKEEKAAAPKEAPFHSALEEDVKKIMQNKGLELGKRTTVDISVGDARIKLGQGGYAGCALASAVVGEGTYACDAKGKVTFKWQKSLEYKDKAWKKGDPSKLIASITLSDGMSCCRILADDCDKLT